MVVIAINGDVMPQFQKRLPFTLEGNGHYGDRESEIDAFDKSVRYFRWGSKWAISVDAFGFCT